MLWWKATLYLGVGEERKYLEVPGVAKDANYLKKYLNLSPKFFRSDTDIRYGKKSDYRAHPIYDNDNRNITTRETDILPDKYMA